MIPKDGKLYWRKPQQGESVYPHLFIFWDEEAQRYCQHLEPAGMVQIKSRTMPTPAIPPRYDGTLLREGVPYEFIAIT